LDEYGNPKEATAHGNCANCGSVLTGHYCQACGQSSHIHRSLLHMLEEFLHGIFHFDTKAWRTIPALIFQPGKLTKEYIRGKCTSFVSPLALFLFLNFLMFFVFSYTIDDNNKESSKTPQTREELVKSLDKVQATLNTELQAETDIIKKHESPIEIRGDIQDSKEEIRQLQDKLDAIDGKKKDRILLQTEITKLEQQLTEIKSSLATDAAAASAASNESTASITNLREEKEQKVDQLEADLKYFKKQISLIDKINDKEQLKANIKATVHAATGKKVEASAIPASVTESSANTDEKDEDGADTNAGKLKKIPWVGYFLSHASKNPDLALYKAKKSASSLGFLLVPLSLPFLWLLFAFRRQFVMFDHAVFSLYSLSFMCVLMMAIAVLGKFGFGGTGGFLFCFVPPIHMFRQLRGAYDLTFSAALWRSFALLIIAFMSLLFYAIIVAGLASA
jgi:hypothetical protein